MTLVFGRLPPIFIFDFESFLNDLADKKSQRKRGKKKKGKEKRDICELFHHTQASQGEGTLRVRPPKGADSAACTSSGERRKIHLPFLKFKLTIFKMVKTAHLPKWKFWTNCHFVHYVIRHFFDTLMNLKGRAPSVKLMEKIKNYYVCTHCYEKTIVADCWSNIVLLSYPYSFDI